MLPSNHKTKIVCTIGPASNNRSVLKKMILAGMNVVRLNFSHGTLDSHRQIIHTVRSICREINCPVTILGDLPGPKIRIGEIGADEILLEHDHDVILTTREVVGDEHCFTVRFEPFPRVVAPNDQIFLNDGYIELQVKEVLTATDVLCEVMNGGKLSSHKGVNLPGIALGISAFTEKDHTFLQFAAQEKIEAISQSFVEDAGDLERVRNAAYELNYNPFLIAKIERRNAYKNLSSILTACDGIMIARGDLGVELPIENMAVIQKNIMHAAYEAVKPVITATQMLESMTFNSRPTRAEATDVANAILDGTDCVMLSGESATGEFPVESVSMLSKIAQQTEAFCTTLERKEHDAHAAHIDVKNFSDLFASTLETVLYAGGKPAAIFVPTVGGYTARVLAKRRLDKWVTAVTEFAKTAADLQFSYGIWPVLVNELPNNWRHFAQKWVADKKLTGDWILLTEGPSAKHPEASHKIELIDLKAHNSLASKKF